MGGPVAISAGASAVVEAMPVALAVSALPIVRPIIGTNTYRQVIIVHYIIYYMLFANTDVSNNRLMYVFFYH